MSNKRIPTKMYLQESELPTCWYNINAVMKEKHAPALNPETLKPLTAEELSEVFCEELVKQELNMTSR